MDNAICTYRDFTGHLKRPFCPFLSFLNSHFTRLSPCPLLSLSLSSPPPSTPPAASHYLALTACCILAWLTPRFSPNWLPPREARRLGKDVVGNEGGSNQSDEDATEATTRGRLWEVVLKGKWEREVRLLEGEGRRKRGEERREENIVISPQFIARTLPVKPPLYE